ncbi:MAG TPA: hypothetical protein ENJ84_14250 [Gammaproteobacteria bacterium]|nr:hypothetical protein [Gammaproteobacteria bacterium]
MDYEIKRNKAELDSTGYIEIGPGKYSGKHWQEGFLFIWEDAFGMAEGIVMKYFKEYDHFGMNDIPKEIGVSISSEWIKAASALKDACEEKYQELLNLDVIYRNYMAAEISGNKQSIIKMLIELAQSFEQFYQTEDWVCILGV